MNDVEEKRIVNKKDLQLILKYLNSKSQINKAREIIKLLIGEEYDSQDFSIDGKKQRIIGKILHTNLVTYTGSKNTQILIEDSHDNMNIIYGGLRLFNLDSGIEAFNILTSFINTIEKLGWIIINPKDICLVTYRIDDEGN